MVFAASVRRSVGLARVVGVPGSKLQNPRISPPSRQRKTKCHMPLIPREKLESVLFAGIHTEKSSVKFPNVL